MSTAELRKLGRFEILGEIGSGGMGVVYKGRDPKINRMVALKVIRTFFGASRKKDEIQALERFYLEAQAAGSLSHQNIVTIYDVGEDDTTEGNIVYIAMEFLDGKGLDHYIDNDGFPTLREKIQIVRQIAEGLDYAHKREVIHRDVKPGNIIITERNIPKLTDFGLARFSDASMTMSGTILGTPNYMSPEQVQGKKVDARSDIFALTVIFYEMLTGIKPFAGETITTVIYKVVNEEPEPPSRIDPSLPKTVDAFIKRGLAKNPSDRFQNGIEYVEALDQILSGSFPAAREAPFDPDATLIVNRSELSYKLESVFNRYKAKIISGGAGAAVLLILGVLYFAMGYGKSAPTQIANTETGAISVGNITEIKSAPTTGGKTPEETAVIKPSQPDKPEEPAQTPKPKEDKTPADSKTATAAAVAKTHLVTIITDPPEAEVSLGGKALGKSPVNKQKFKEGHYKLVVKHKGYETFQRQIALNSDMVINDVVLVKQEQAAAAETPKKPPVVSAPVETPPAASNLGSLKINVPQGSGTLIYVDGKEYREENLSLTDLSPGSHLVYIQIPGRNPYTSRITIEAGRTVRISCLEGKECH